jgi:hypothetical protein
MFYRIVVPRFVFYETRADIVYIMTFSIEALTVNITIKNRGNSALIAVIISLLSIIALNTVMLNVFLFRLSCFIVILGVVMFCANLSVLGPASIIPVFYLIQLVKLNLNSF